MSNNNTPSKGELQSALERIAPCVNTEKAREAFEMVRSFVEGAQPAAAWPQTPADIRDFIGSSFTSAKLKNWSESCFIASDAEPHEDDLYTVSAHDLLEAFSFWSDATPTGVAADTAHALLVRAFGALRDERQLRECTPPEDRPRAEPNVAIRTDKLIADINAWLYARAADESTRAPDALSGIATLENVIACLRDEGRYVDDEGEATNALEDLLTALKGAK